MNKAGNIMLLAFKIYYRTTVIKTVSYMDKNRCLEQQHIIESPEINSHIYE